MINPFCTCTLEPPREWVKGVCVKCWTWAHNPALRTVAKRTPNGPRPPKNAALPCVYLGEELSASDAVKLGLGSLRRYRVCGMGMAKNLAKVSGYACKCSGCGPKCEGYKST